MEVDSNSQEPHIVLSDITAPAPDDSRTNTDSVGNVKPQPVHVARIPKQKKQVTVIVAAVVITLNISGVLVFIGLGVGQGGPFSVGHTSDEAVLMAEQGGKLLLLVG